VGTSVRQPQRELSALLLIVSAAVASAVAMEIIPGLTALALANDRITADHSTSTSSDSVPKQLQSPDKRPSPPSLKIFQEAAEATSATASDIPPTTRCRRENAISGADPPPPYRKSLSTPCLTLFITSSSKSGSATSTSWDNTATVTWIRRNSS
jgi:hypothetical protein